MTDIFEALTFITETEITEENQEEYRAANDFANEYLNQPDSLFQTLQLITSDSQVSDKIKSLLLMHYITALQYNYPLIVSENKFPEILDAFFPVLSIPSLVGEENSLNLLIQILAYIVLNFVESFEQDFATLPNEFQFRFLFFFMEEMNDYQLNHRKAIVCEFMQNHFDLFIQIIGNIEDDILFVQYCTNLILAPEGRTDLDFLHPHLERISNILLNKTATAAGYAFFDALCDNSFGTDILINIASNVFQNLRNFLQDAEMCVHTLTLWEAIFSMSNEKSSDLITENPEFLGSLLSEFFIQIETIIPNVDPSGLMKSINLFSFFFSDMFTDEEIDEESYFHQFGETFIQLLICLIETDDPEFHVNEMQESIKEMLDNRSMFFEDEIIPEYLTIDSNPAAFLFFLSSIDISSDIANEAAAELLSLDPKPSTTISFLSCCVDSFSENIGEILDLTIQLYQNGSPKEQFECSVVIKKLSFKYKDIAQELFSEISELITDSLSKSNSNIVSAIFNIISSTSADISGVLSTLHQFFINLCQEAATTSQINLFLDFFNPLIPMDSKTDNEQVAAFYTQLFQDLIQIFSEHFTDLNIAEQLCTFFAHSVCCQWCNDPSIPLTYANSLLELGIQNSLDNLLAKLYYLLQFLYPYFEAFPPILQHFVSLDFDQQIEECCSLLELINTIIEKNDAREHFLMWFPLEFLFRFLTSSSPRYMPKTLLLMKNLISFFEIPDDSKVFILQQVFEHLQVDYKPLPAELSAQLILEMKKHFEPQAISQLFMECNHTESGNIEEICEMISSTDEINTDDFTRLIKRYNINATTQTIVLKPPS